MSIWIAKVRKTDGLIAVFGEISAINLEILALE
jgi:hypothetical protein